jgi:hypothetical protein
MVKEILTRARLAVRAAAWGKRTMVPEQLVTIG